MGSEYLIPIEVFNALVARAEKAEADLRATTEQRDTALQLRAQWEKEAAHYLQAAHASGADLAEIGRLCGIRDDEYPLKAVQRMVATAASRRAHVERLALGAGRIEAQAAAMREVLSGLIAPEVCNISETWRKRIAAALSSDAGRDLLKERDGLRRAVDGAIARLSEGGLADGSARVGDVVAGLRAALAALDGGDRG